MRMSRLSSYKQDRLMEHFVAGTSYDAREELDTDTEEDVAACGQHSAIRWHWDTPNQLAVFVALDDIAEDGTTTMYAKGSHKKWHRSIFPDQDNDYSEKFVMENFEVVKFSANRGSAVIFDSNGLHRYYPVKDSYRNTMLFMVTPGNNILDIPKLEMVLRDGVDKPKKPDLSTLQ